MSKGTTIRDALTKWSEKTGQKPDEATEIALFAQYPPIDKMDASVNTLVACRKLSLSTNAIEKITNLNGLSVSISLCVCFTNWIIF
jgi:dynein light chain 1